MNGTPTEASPGFDAVPGNQRGGPWDELSHGPDIYVSLALELVTLSQW